jgi:hypothetical protein
LDTFREFAADVPDVTEHLEGYGLVLAVHSDSPSISLELVAEYLRSHDPVRDAGSTSIKNDPDAVASEISLRRNAIERRLRDVLAQILHMRYGARAIERVLTCLPEQRRTALASVGYQEMWKEMYFDELTRVIDKNWDDVAGGFGGDKEEAIRWMDTVNRWRRVDAHAGDIDEDDLAYLRVCFGRLETVLGIAEPA